MAGDQGASKLNLARDVDVTKLRYFSIEDCGGHFLVSNVDPELKLAQQYGSSET